jgi:hypothetical protein
MRVSRTFGGRDLTAEQFATNGLKLISPEEALGPAMESYRSGVCAKLPELLISALQLRQRRA